MTSGPSSDADTGRPFVRANPARALAVRVVQDVLGGERFAAPELDAALSRSDLSARDSGLATHLVYGTLRHLPALEAALTPLLRGETAPKTRALLLTAAFERLILGTPAHAAVNEYVSLGRQGFGPPGLINAVLRRLPERLDPDPASALPEWLRGEYDRAYGEQAPAIFAALLEGQPLWLRLTPDGVNSLRAEGSELGTPRGDVYPVGLDRPLRRTEAYKQGWAQPINPASLASVLALGEVAGQGVLDLAGGAGIKAAMLSAEGAQVTSVDRVPAKHRAARDNLERLGLQVRLFTADLTKTPPLDPAAFVLLDAPCTGSGTLRSHPEIKLRLTQEAVQQAAALQGQLLDTAARLTRPGGMLVYSVCSVTGAEGPDAAAAFLARHPDFRPEPLPPLNVDTAAAGPGVRTVPLDGVDGFYIARLRRDGEA